MGTEWCRGELKAKDMGEEKPKQPSIWLIVVAVSILIWIAARVGSFNQLDRPAGPRPAERIQSGEYQVTPDSPSWWQLAALEAGTMYPPASLAKMFETLQVSLQEKCANADGAIHSKPELADIIVHTREVLRKRGKDMGLLQIAQALDDSISQEAKVGDCRDVAIVFIAIETAR